jgi:hypothetical protein
LSQAQIEAISAPICAFYRRLLGGSSVVSAQPCPLRFRSGSKVGQNFLAGGFQSGNVVHQSVPYRGNINRPIGTNIEIPGIHDDSLRNQLVPRIDLIEKLGHFTRNYTQTTKRGLLTTNKG